MNYEEARTKMVDNQIRPCDVTDLDVLTAFLSVPREAFFAEDVKDLAYLDRDHRLGDAGRHLMSPANLAKLIQLCGTDAGDVALVIGPGNGYSAAIFSHLVSSVVALEEDAELANEANETLSELGCDNVAVLNGPLDKGWEREAPYDVIFVDGSVEEVPSIWCEQLAEGGKLVVTVGNGTSARATVMTRKAGITGEVPEFNLSVPALPGFAKEVEFSL